MTQLKSDADKRYNDSQKLYNDQTKRAVSSFKNKYENILNDRQAVINKLNTKTSANIEQLKKDYTDKLNSYSNRNSDPFYRMVDIGTSMSETDQAFKITASIPSHEQDSVFVNVTDNSVTIMGQRRTEETAEVGPGQKRTTSSFQSYSETLPISWPIEKQYVKREFDGDTLIVTLPKKSMDLTYKPAQPKASAVEQIAANRPVFPKNLPVPPQANADSDDPNRKLEPGELGPEPELDEPYDGSGTLV